MAIKNSTDTSCNGYIDHNHIGESNEICRRQIQRLLSEVSRRHVGADGADGADGAARADGADGYDGYRGPAGELRWTMGERVLRRSHTKNTYRSSLRVILVMSMPIDICERSWPQTALGRLGLKG